MPSQTRKCSKRHDKFLRSEAGMKYEITGFNAGRSGSNCWQARSSNDCDSRAGTIHDVKLATSQGSMRCRRPSRFDKSANVRQRSVLSELHGTCGCTLAKGGLPARCTPVLYMRYVEQFDCRKVSIRTTYASPRIAGRRPAR